MKIIPQPKIEREWAILKPDGSFSFLEPDDGSLFYLQRLGRCYPRLAHQVSLALKLQVKHPHFKAVRRRLVLGARLVQVGAVQPPLDLWAAQSYLNEVARIRGNAVVQRYHGLGEHQQPLFWCSCLDHQLGFHHSTFGYPHPEYGMKGAPLLPSGQILCADVAAYWLQLGLNES